MSNKNDSIKDFCNQYCPEFPQGLCWQHPSNRSYDPANRSLGYKLRDCPFKKEIMKDMGVEE